MNPARWSVTQQRAALARGEVTPTALVEACLERIAQEDGTLHSLTQVFAEEARRRARELETRQPQGALWGIPWVAKEILATRAGNTTCGSKLLETFRSPYDATVVQRVHDAGAILLGKTNMDEFGMGSSTENSAFEPTRNPWDRDRVPGGSSGGAAAAVAADLAGFALGSDTGGSLRQPAGFCGVVGLKPTYGRVSRFGLVAFASSLDQVGPITKTVVDAACILQVIAGADERDSTSLDRAVPDFGVRGAAAAARAALPAPRVGVPRGVVVDGVDACVRDDFFQVLERMRAAGCQVVDLELPHLAHANAAYYVVATAEAASNLARFDGVRFTRRAAGARDVAELFELSRREGFGEEVKRRILLGTYVLSSGYYDAYYLRALKLRTLLRRDFEAAFACCDVIAMPTSPSPAFRLREKTEDPLQMYLSDVFTVPANLAGLPAIALPTGTSQGLPLSIQLYAPALEEARLLGAAAWLEALLGFQRLGSGAEASGS